jgi:diaminopimelate decarboxylase
VDYFSYRDGRAQCEELPLTDLAETEGTPLYVYSKATLARHCQNLKKAFAAYPTLPCFAVKANSNLSFLREIFSHGFGADLVSIGELERSLLAGVNPKDIVYSGVGKRHDEIERALSVGIGSFNAESAYELKHIESIAKQRKLKAPITLRVNPDIDAKTNPKIATGLYSTKFGLKEDIAWELMETIRHSEHLTLTGVSCHIGSQITQLQPLQEAAKRMAKIASRALEVGHKLDFVNMGGGLGIRYRDESPPSLEDYAGTLINEIKPTGLRLLIEPGRVVAGNTGVLVTRVIGVKKTAEKYFVVVDAAMNDLLRPSLYGSYHDILPVKEPTTGENVVCDIVGPICETGDFLGKDRTMKLPEQGDLLYIRGCGAYAATMASNYNSRPRSAEVLVNEKAYRVIRPREKLTSLWESELEGLK